MVPVLNYLAKVSDSVGYRTSVFPELVEVFVSVDWLISLNSFSLALQCICCITSGSLFPNLVPFYTLNLSR